MQVMFPISDIRIISEEAMIYLLSLYFYWVIFKKLFHFLSTVFDDDILRSCNGLKFDVNPVVIVDEEVVHKINPVVILFGIF